MIRWVTKVLGRDTICNIAASCLALPTMVYPHSLELPCLYIAMAPSAAGTRRCRGWWAVWFRIGSTNGWLYIIAPDPWRASISDS